MGQNAEYIDAVSPFVFAESGAHPRRQDSSPIRLAGAGTPDRAARHVARPVGNRSGNRSFRHGQYGETRPEAGLDRARAYDRPASQPSGRASRRVNHSAASAMTRIVAASAPAKTKEPTQFFLAMSC